MKAQSVNDSLGFTCFYVKAEFRAAWPDFSTYTAIFQCEYCHPQRNLTCDPASVDKCVFEGRGAGARQAWESEGLGHLPPGGSAGQLSVRVRPPGTAQPFQLCVPLSV